MPLTGLHLVSLDASTSLSAFLALLHSLPPAQRPVIVSKVIRWIILPERVDVDALLEPSKPWDLLIISPSTEALPEHILSHVKDHFHLQIGIPSRLLKDFSQKNDSLLHPPNGSIPPLTGALRNPIVQRSSQTLSLSSELQTWIASFSRTKAGRNAVSMLNLLAFVPEKRKDYMRYGEAFAKTIGSRRGGDAKLVGHVVEAAASPSVTSLPYPSPSSREARNGGIKWDEFALAHYPSIMHFADMLASEDYQAVNQKYRVPSLEDTCILCTSEIEAEDLMLNMGGGSKARL